MDKFDSFCTQITRIVSDDDEQEIPSRVRRELKAYHCGRLAEGSLGRGAR